MGETKFKKKNKVTVGASNVQIWGTNVTSRGNKSQWGKGVIRVFKDQSVSVHEGESEQNGEERK